MLLTGCGSSGGGYGYGDGPPPRDVDVTHLPDAVPKVEPIRKAGNKSPYTVLGKTYRVLPSSLGFRQRGTASWYGNKFHGRKTSNGETYSMYEMTAAHKTLPIPCYVKVTNLDNGRSAIVRVNDRGPFHGDRIIDLSYAAAKKLDYSSKGTAHVEVVAIDPHNYQRNSVERPHMPATAELQQQPQPMVVRPMANEHYQLPANTYLQVGAFSSETAAQSLSERVQQLSSFPVVVREQVEPRPLFKVLVGPVTNNLKLIDLRNLLGQVENLRSFVVYE
jgi:rare lipoprotein A